MECENGAVKRIGFSGGRTAEVRDRVVSTLPLPLLVGLLGDAVPEAARAAASRLRFRHVRLLFLRLATARLSGNASIYIPEPAFCVSRIYDPGTGPRPWRRRARPRSSWKRRASGRRGRPAFGRGVPGKVVGELSTLRLLDPRDVLESRPHFIANAYPVCTNGYEGRGGRPGGSRRDRQPGDARTGGTFRLQPSPRPAAIRQGLRAPADRLPEGGLRLSQHAKGAAIRCRGRSGGRWPRARSSRRARHATTRPIGPGPGPF